MDFTKRMERVKESVKKYLDISAAFFLTEAILVSAFIVLGIYPFGDSSIIDNDLYHQYLPIMAELQRVIHDGGSILYSFHGGLGTNFLVMNAYQNASPITWIFLALSDEEHLTMAVTWMIIFKIGLAAGTICYYFRSKPGINSAVTLSLSITYALSGYVLAYYYNVMWLEGVILLPIIAMGLQRAVCRKGGRLYVISLALMLFTNYYIGSMICIFLALYFFVYFFSERKSDLAKDAVHIGALSVLAVLSAMIVLLPTYHALLKTDNYETLGHAASGFLYNDVWDHLAQLLPNSSVTSVYGPPNLYSGLAPLILLFVFAVNKDIDRRKRITLTAFACFIFACTNIAPLDLVWHLMHVPNGIPARYSFLFTFMLADIAAESLRHIEGANKKDIYTALALTTLIYVAVFAGRKVTDPDRAFMLISGLIFLSLYAFVLLYTKRLGTEMSMTYLAVVIIFEITVVTVHGFGSAGLVQTDKYSYHSEDIGELVETALSKDPDARIDIIDADNANAPYMYGYNGVSIFSSSVPGINYRILDKLLLKNGDSPDINQFKFDRVGVIPDAILNLGFYISINEEIERAWLSEIAEVNGCHLYENKYHTSLGYMVSPEMKEADFELPRTELLNQFTEIAANKSDIVDDDHIELELWDEIYPYIFKETLTVDSFGGNRLVGRINTGQGGILMMAIPYDDGWHIKVDGTEVKDVNEIAYFISFAISEGDHTVEMRFVPKGLVSGAVISIISMICYAAYEISTKRRGLKNTKQL